MKWLPEMSAFSSLKGLIPLDPKPYIERHFQNNLLRENLDKHGICFPEWWVTVLFYSAVQAVDAYFAKKNESYGNHKDRNKAIGRTNSGIDSVYDDYMELYRLSKEARYEPDLAFGDRQVQKAVKAYFYVIDKISVTLPELKPLYSPYAPTKQPVCFGSAQIVEGPPDYRV
jgi:hypothetical protein